MERGSDKHGPLVDEEMKQETRPIEQGSPVPARVEEHREVEPIDDDDDDRANDRDDEEELGKA